MNRKVILKVTVLSCVLLLQISCSEVPLTGRHQLNIVSDSSANAMGLQAYQEFLTSSKLSGDAAQTQTVKDVGAKIQKAVEQYCAQNNLSSRIQGYQWEFNLAEDPNANAWCLPGGKVVVYTGILPITRNDAGLAVVMSHEIAHAVAKHGSERVSQETVVKAGSTLLSKILLSKTDQTKEIFMKSYGMGTQLGVLLPYSRLQENEADHMGLIFMAMAGYNPNEAVSFWERMAAASKGQKPLEFLSTHPADSTRISNIKRLIPEAMRYYKP